MSSTYVVCGCKSWNKEVFDSTLSTLPGSWHYIGSKDELTLETLQQLQPRYVFFLHWSWIVPSQLLEAFECINFHMTDLPYGRGGSPLQNLIVRGHKATKLSAFRMTDVLDGGPIYLKKDLSLEGTASEILTRSSELAVSMISDIVSSNPEPVEQDGEVVEFTRRTPEDCRIPEDADLATVFDYIRMLDGEGYPPAFVEYGGFRYEFTNAKEYDGGVEASVRITPSS